jgi:hypothetical protein
LALHGRFHTYLSFQVFNDFYGIEKMQPPPLTRLMAGYSLSVKDFEKMKPVLELLTTNQLVAIS